MSAVVVGLGLSLRGCVDWSTVALLHTRVDAGEFGGGVPEERLPTVARASRSWQPTVRRAATRLLALSGAPAATEALLARVGDERQPEIWALAVEAIEPASRMATALEERGTFVQAQLSSTVPTVRAAALRALPHADLPDADTACGEALPDPVPEVRVAALRCLGATEPAQHVAALIDRAAIEEQGTVRLALLDTLGDVPDPQAAVGATRLLEREAAEPKIAGGTGPALARLARGPTPWTRDVVIELACEEGALQAGAVRALSGLPVPPCLAELCQVTTAQGSASAGGAPARALQTACLSLDLERP